MDVKVGQEGVKGQMTCMRREAGHVDVEKEIALLLDQGFLCGLAVPPFQGEE